MKISAKSGLLILFIVVGGLAAFDIYKSSKSAKLEKQNLRLVTNDIEQVDKIQITSELGEVLMLRGVDGWKLVKPLEDFADNDAVEEYLKGLNAEKVIDTVGTDAAVESNWSEFGLESPAAVIRLTTSAGKTDTLALSKMTNFEKNIYARRNGETRAIVASSILLTRAEKKAIDFRERRVFRHALAGIDRFKIVYKSEKYDFERLEGRWMLAGSPEVVLDQNKIRDMLSEFGSALAAEYVEKLPKGTELFRIEVKRGDKPWAVNVVQDSDFAIYAETSEPKYNLLLESGALDYFLEFTINNVATETKSVDQEESAELKN